MSRFGNTAPRYAKQALLTALVAAVLLASGVYALPSTPSSTGAARSVNGHRMRQAQPVVTVGVGAPRRFVIRGSAAGLLAPGVGAVIDLRLTNPYRFSLSVRRVGVSIAGIRAPYANRVRPCSRADFIVNQPGQLAGLRLPAHSTRSLASLRIRPSRWPRVAMRSRPVNQDGCKHATLMLRYTGIAFGGRT
jgi:hypothetical protein